MTNETILTDERIFALAAETDIVSIDPKVDVLMFSRDEMLQAARAIEQAVLQSPEIHVLRKDAERYRATRAGLVGKDPDYGSRFCAYCDAAGIRQSESITEDQFDAATDAAMEKQP